MVEHWRSSASISVLVFEDCLRLGGCVPLAWCKSSRLAISCLLSAVHFNLAGVTPCNWFFLIPRSAPSCAFLAHALVCCFCYGPFLAFEVSPGHRHRFASLLFVPQQFFYHAVAMIAWLRSCAAELHPVSLPQSLPSDWACPVGTVQGLSPCLSPARCRPRTSLSMRACFLSFGSFGYLGLLP